MTARWDTYNRFIAITPSDTVNFLEGDQFHALYVGGAGNAVLVFNDDSTMLMSGLLAGTIYPFRNVKRINATSTTATLLRGLQSV